MTVPLSSLLLTVLGLLVLGGLALLMATWADRRLPRVRHGFVRLGDAAITFALGLLGATMIAVLLRALGWLPLH